MLFLCISFQSECIFYVCSILVGDYVMGFRDAAVWPSRASFIPHFSKFVVEVKTSGLPQVLKVWMGVSKSMLPVVLFLCKSNFMKITRQSHI